jgi:hypothetical protein
METIRCTIVSDADFNLFWTGINQNKWGNDVKARIFEYRALLHNAWAYRVHLLNIEKGSVKSVNKWEYLTAWRQIAATGGWFIEDLPRELQELSKILDIDFEPRLDAQGEQMCIDLYDSWEKSGVHENRQWRLNIMGKTLFQLFEDVKKSDRFFRIQANGYRPPQDPNDGLSFEDRWNYKEPSWLHSPIDAMTSQGSSSTPIVDSGESHDTLDDALMHDIVKDDVLEHPSIPQSEVYNSNQTLRIISTVNANKHFDNITTLEHAKDLPVPAWEAQTLTIPSTKRQAFLIAAFPTVDLRHPDRLALDLIDEACSDMASRFFERIREQHGLAYSVGTTQVIGMAPGLFAFYLSTSPEQLAFAQKELLSEIATLAADGLTAEELDRARRTWTGKQAMQHQSNAGLAQQSALNELYGLGCDHDQRILGRVRTLPLTEVNLVAARYFRDTAPIIVQVAPPHPASNS